MDTSISINDSHTQRHYKTIRSETIHSTTQTSCLAKKRTKDLEKVHIISPSTSNTASSIIIVPEKTDTSTHKVMYKMVADCKKINEQLKYCSYPLMRIDRTF